MTFMTSKHFILENSITSSRNITTTDYIVDFYLDSSTTCDHQRDTH